jgi:hypothetical protein
LARWADKRRALGGRAAAPSGYEEINPQSPLGGPDGKKDIICAKGGVLWVVAVHFPNGPVKFVSDLEGASSGASGFVFVTNQTLSPGQREALGVLARGAGKEIDIVHLQQMQTLLDSPSGYGARIQYLRIPMSIEDQLSWAVESDTQTARAISANTRELMALRGAVERLDLGQAHILKTLNQTSVGAAPTPDLISQSAFSKEDPFEPVSAGLDASTVLLFHRLTCFDLPSRAVGVLRSNDVWLSNLDGRRATHMQPPPADEVGPRLSDLCTEWREQFPGLRKRDRKLLGIAVFHQRFLSLHPFLDGNGRVARAILMQQCLDLFGKADMTLMNKGADYYAALKDADAGDARKLASLIEPIVAS